MSEKVAYLTVRPWCAEHLNSEVEARMYTVGLEKCCLRRLCIHERNRNQAAGCSEWRGVPDPLSGGVAVGPCGVCRGLRRRVRSQFRADRRAVSAGGNFWGIRKRKSAWDRDLPPANVRKAEA